MNSDFTGFISSINLEHKVEEIVYENPDDMANAVGNAIGAIFKQVIEDNKITKITTMTNLLASGKIKFESIFNFNDLSFKAKLLKHFFKVTPKISLKKPE